MKARFDQHARFRELLAARLDRQLTRVENRVLVAHLRTCPECRQAERDYLDQRSLLRTLPRPTPPRDMWARTSTALDREVARWSYRYPRFGRPRVPTGDERPRAGAPSGLATAVAALGIVTVLAVLQMAPANRALPAPDGAVIPSAARGPSASVGVSSARPTPFSVAAQPPLFVVSGGGGNDLTVYRTDLSQVCPQDDYDCLIDEGITRQSIPFAKRIQPENVALSPNGSEMAFVGTDEDRDVIAVVMLGRNGSGGAPSPEPQATPDGPPEESVAPPDATPKRPTATPDPTVAATARASREPPATQPATPRVTPRGSDAPATSAPATEPATATEPPPEETPDTNEPTTTAEPTATPEETSTSEETLAPTLVASPPSSAVPGLEVLSILEDVHSAGAPPAWSRDGAILAFSAMPADGSHGPDVYVWRPGDERASAITNDHASYFASWSGRRIVFSRLLGDDARSDSVEIETVVIDPQTLDERTVDGPQMWLPVVDPQRTHAIAWQGQLGRRNGQPVLRSGALYLVDWAALNPFRIAQPGEQPSSEIEMVPLEPQRDPADRPVVDWSVRWSTDGRVIGIWEGETLNAPWGRLELFVFDRTAGRLDEQLIEPQHARRGFAVGVDRVAWVGLSGDGPEGELRIRTWGTDGVGGLRIRAIDVEDFVPTF